jgi:SAM-dependent methyltransferase
MARPDMFEHLARYYDPLMEHVNYDRWLLITTALAELAPKDFRHVDLGCGTGVLVNMLRHAGWQSVGLDLSEAMVRAGRHTRRALPLGVADLRNLPLNGSVDFITCLFDSMNFLLEEQEVRRALCQCADALTPGGLLYFDIVTERMVKEHFAGQQWTEQNGAFNSSWKSAFDENTACSRTEVRVNTGHKSAIEERIYPTAFFREAVEDAGLKLLAMYDAETWQPPRNKTTRVDFVAVKAPQAGMVKRFTAVRKQILAQVYP